MMSGRDRYIESVIRKAIEEGKFENLSGQGKPLDLGENPFVAPEWRMAFRILEKEGLALPWMEKRKQIEASFETARASLARTWAWRQEKLAIGESEGWVEAEWKKAVQVFEEQCAKLNKRIDDYNLETPGDVFQRERIDVGREIGEIRKDQI
jgi:DnaJ family protein C protein 28